MQKCVGEDGGIYYASGGEPEKFVCERCGEDYMSDDTLDLLEAICPICKLARHNELRPVLSAIEDTVSKLHKGYERAELAGVNTALTYDYLAMALEEEARVIRGYEGHSHDWNEDDYCNICGADGRA